MGLKLLASALFGLFARSSLMNAWAGYVSRAHAMSLLEPGQERFGTVFFRIWISVNLVSFFLLLAAAVFVWYSWSVAIALACLPVAFWAILSVKHMLRGPREKE